MERPTRVLVRHTSKIEGCSLSKSERRRCPKTNSKSAHDLDQKFQSIRPGKKRPIEAKLSKVCAKDGPKPHAAVGLVLGAFGELLTKGRARLILDRFHLLLLSPGNPTTDTHEPDSFSHEYFTFFFHDRGHEGMALQTPLASAGGVAAEPKHPIHYRFSLVC